MLEVQLADSTIQQNLLQCRNRLMYKLIFKNALNKYVKKGSGISNRHINDICTHVLQQQSEMCILGFGICRWSL